jgi:sialate O-acetylesterase
MKHTFTLLTALLLSPVAVRYAWSDNPECCNLYNSVGLPASPFRIDIEGM